VVSESFARRRLPDPPLGQSVELLSSSDDPPVVARVVGVVADLGLDRPDSPGAEERIYVPSSAGVFLLVRARAASTGVLRAIERRLAQLFVAFGGVAVLLGAIGLHGVLALVTRRRERELGIRAAIGAVPRDLFALVLREGTRTLAVGLALGAGLALLLARQVGGLLPGIELHHTSAALAAAAVVLVASALASWLPARQAARVDPVEMLRRD
jgi:ABC-type antimicrobial peptide transport system permease subunit